MMRFVAAVLLLPALALAQDRIDLNKITRVEVKDGAIRVNGSRTPNFNTFMMSDPPRLVIDISEAVFAGVPEVIPGQGPITGVKTASYGSASAAIARVVVGFDREVETDIQTEGNAITVRLAGVTAPVAAAANAGAAPGTQVAQIAPGAPDPAAQEQAAAEAHRRAEEERKRQEEEARQAAARAEEERKRQESERQKAEQAAREKAEATRLAEAEAAQKRAAEENARRRADEERKAEAEARRKAEEDRKAQEQAAKEAAERARKEAEERRRIEAEAAKQAALERKRAEEEAREAARKAEEERQAQERAAREAALAAKKAAEEERKRQEAEAREAARRAEEERKAQQRAQREAEAAAKKRVEDERREREKAEREEKARIAEEKRKAEAEERARREEQKRQQAEVQRLAMAAQKPAGGATRAAAGHRVLGFVGFRPAGRVSRVFIRTDAPAPYEIREEDERTVVVVLPNTRIGSKNNARFLDTSFFDTPVMVVNPTEVGAEVHVEVKLKSAVPYQARQNGSELVLEFQAPGA